MKLLERSNGQSLRIEVGSCISLNWWPELRIVTMVVIVYMNNVLYIYARILSRRVPSDSLGGSVHFPIVRGLPRLTNRGPAFNRLDNLGN